MRLKRLPATLPPPCDCETQAHDIVQVSPDETLHVCRSCLRSVAIIRTPSADPATAAGILGGQDHAAAEVEQGAELLLTAFLLLLGVALVIASVR